MLNYAENTVGKDVPPHLSQCKLPNAASVKLQVTCQNLKMKVYQLTIKYYFTILSPYFDKNNYIYIVTTRRERDISLILV